MTDSTQCPNCGERYAVSPELADKRVTCRKCEHLFTIPPVAKPVVAERADPLVTSSPGTCPHCGAETASGVAYCRNCARRVTGFVACEACKEPITRGATFCPYCTQRVPTETDRALAELQLTVRATNLGAFLTSGRLTSLFLPPIISVSEGRIRVTKWTFLGLRIHQQEIQVSRVASVRYTKGVIWGGILIETFGGAAEDLSEKGLQQEDARTMANQLKAVLSDRM